MRRREFILIAGAGALAWPVVALAQQSVLPVLGILSVSRQRSEYNWQRFGRDLRALGWEENRNIRVLQRWPAKPDQSMTELARDLVAQGATVLYAGAGNPAIRAAQEATSSVPIVGLTDDMLASGLIASLARPGGNTTGVSILASELNVKRLELLHELVPQARRFAILGDPTTVSTHPQLESAGREFGLELFFHSAKNHDEIQAEISNMAGTGTEAVDILASPLLNEARFLIIELLAKIAIPAIYQWPETAQEGGLMGYGPRNTLCYRHAAVLVDKILHGARPADLPVEQPNVFTLAINVKTAKSLGLTIPPGLLLRADEVIE